MLVWERAARRSSRAQEGSGCSAVDLTQEVCTLRLENRHTLLPRMHFHHVYAVIEV